MIQVNLEREDAEIILTLLGELDAHFDDWLAVEARFKAALDGSVTTVISAPPAPVEMAFGFFSFGGTTYMSIVPKQMWDKDQYLDDSSPWSAATRILLSGDPENYECEDTETWDAAESKIEDWYRLTCKDVLVGEPMESTFEFRGTQEEARFALEANGLHYVDMSCLNDD